MPTVPQVLKCFPRIKCNAKSEWVHSLCKFVFLLCYYEGQLLDEVAMRCVNPADCKVCVHEGQRILHGNKVIFNRDDPERCKIWY